MNKDQCRFCAYSKQSLYYSQESVFLTDNLQVCIQASLYRKHGNSQNYFYARPIYAILKDEKSLDSIRLKEQEKFDAEEEFLKQFHSYQQAIGLLVQLSHYYKFSIDHPWLFMDEHKELLKKYNQKRSQYEYEWAMRQIDIEQNGKITPKRKRITAQTNVDYTQFLKDISITQKSMTIVNLLNNVQADKTIEKDWQRNYTQSLMDQDILKTKLFTNFLSREQFNKTKQISQFQMTLRKNPSMTTIRLKTFNKNNLIQPLKLREIPKLQFQGLKSERLIQNPVQPNRRYKTLHNEEQPQSERKTQIGFITRNVVVNRHQKFQSK